MSTKAVRKFSREILKKPRPLKSTCSVDAIKYHIQDPKDSVVQKSKDDILKDLEILNVSISNCNFDEVTAADIARMCAILKKRGEELDKFHKEEIDRYLSTLRNASREERLDQVSRLRLLEVVEIRANGWKMNENILNYYNSKIIDLEQGVQDLTLATSTSMTSVPFSIQNQNVPVINALPLAPGEILRSSGKFAKPTKIAGKNVFKDEILIRNSDSGKVSPGARDRLVQITGPHEEAIGHAKLLVEDTIRRNASPVRESPDMPFLDNAKDSLDYNNSYSSLDNQMFMKRNLQHSLSDASLREHCVSVQIDQDLIALSGTNAELLKTAKLVLMEYFAGQTEINQKQHENYSSRNRQSSPERNKNRYELQKQSSLKGNFDNIYPSGFGVLSRRVKRESISPVSSLDDDFVMDDKKNEMNTKLFIPETSSKSGPENIKVTMNYSDSNQYVADSLYLTDTVKHRTVFLETSNAHGQLIRRSSVPNDFGNVFPEMHSPDNEEVFSAIDSGAMTIPPPTYKKTRYSRESLLNLANSPLSHNQPEDYAHIHQNFRDIICQSPVMFDPQKFIERNNRSDDVTTATK